MKPSIRRKPKYESYKGPVYPIDLTDQLRERLMALPGSVKTDYLKEQVFSKYVSRDTDPPALRKQRALTKWLATEAVNEETALRLLTTHEEYNILPRVPYRSFMRVCRDLIQEVLGGELPPSDVTLGSFSGGASTSRPRTSSQPANKYYGKAHVTAAAQDAFSRLVASEVPGWLTAQSSCDLRVQDVPGNVMFTVPKKTDIDRVAAKEPDLNMYMQKGVGDHIRRRLMRSNINLNDQSINRSLALRGSIDGSLATLDLSSASDSVTRTLVLELLPVNWFVLLDSLRSPETRLLQPEGSNITGALHRNEMFSSMGNGFTFELESLLFFAIVKTTCILTGTPGIVSVYGDDIILPTEVANLAISVLKHFGFQVNPEKSFVDGPFRESCGGHYHNGIDITPFYVKAPLDHVVDVMHVANQLREWAELRANGVLLSPCLDPVVEDLWLWLKSLVPSYLWGGKDTSYKYQLTSHDVPSKRLLEESKTVMVDDRRGYAHWLNTSWRRTSLAIGSSTLYERLHLEPIVTSSYTTPIKAKYRLKSVRDKTVPRLEAEFYHELC